MSPVKVFVSGRAVDYSGDITRIKGALIAAGVPVDRVRAIAPALATEITVTPREERLLLGAGPPERARGPRRSLAPLRASDGPSPR